MEEFVEWCNENQGFLSFILAISSILISVIAIIVSIRTSQLPYKRKIKISTFYQYDFEHVFNETFNDFYSCCIEVLNIGHSDVRLKYIGIGCFINGKLKKVYSISGGNKSFNSIRPLETITTNIFAKDLLDVSKQIPKDTKIYAITIDIKGKVRKKHISTIGELVDNILK